MPANAQAFIISLSFTWVWAMIGVYRATVVADRIYAREVRNGAH